MQRFKFKSGEPSADALRPSRHSIDRLSELAVPILLVVFSLGIVTPLGLSSAVLDGALALTLLFFVLLTSSSSPLPIKTILLMLVGVIGVGATGRANFLAFSLVPALSYLAQHFNIRVTLRALLTTFSLAFSAIVALYYLAGFNIQNDVTMWRSSSEALVERSAVGFLHPNQAMLSWAIVVLGALVLARFSAKKLHFFLLSLGTTLFFFLTDSRTSGYLLLVVLVLAVLFTSRLQFSVNLVVRRIVVLLPIAFFGISLMMPGLAGNQEINALLSGRPQIYADHMGESNAISLWGNAAVEDAMFDNGFLHMLLSKGVLFTGAYMWLLTWLITTPKRISFATMILIAFFCAAALAETVLLNFPLLFLVICSLQQDRNEWGARANGR